MGRVTATAVVSNIHDFYRHHLGEIAEGEVRKFEIAEALVDTGASNLSLPKSMIAALGLFPMKKRRVMTVAGVQDVAIFGAVDLRIDGRNCTCDVTEIPDECPVLIGQVPLQLMDFVVDPKRHRIIANPAHNGEWIMDLF